MQFFGQWRVRISATCCVVALLSGCATKTKILDFTEINNRAETDYDRLFAEAPTAGSLITLPEAIARTLKYNLDNRLKMMEGVVAQQRLDLLNYQKLPELAAEAGYTVRSNRQASSSLNLTSGVPNFGASTSQENGVVDGQLQASWDTLNFGIAYLNAKQAGNDTLIAVERHRKTLHNIVRDVRYAYWRMVSANRVEDSLNGLLVEIRQGLTDSYATQKAKLKPLEECLEYQRAMLDLQRQVLTLQRDIANARVELTALMGMAPGSDFKVESESELSAPPDAISELDVSRLQQLALRNRPELLEEDYQKRNALTEVRKARLKMIPGIELFTNYNFNDNSFLLNETWASTGYRISWNLLNLISGPAGVRHAKSTVELANLRRMALSVAVLTQVDVAIHQLNQAQQDFGIAAELHRVDEGMFEQYTKQLQASQIDQLTMVQAKARRLVSSMRYAMSYAEWQQAIGQLNASVGYQPATIIDYRLPLIDLTTQVEKYLQAPAFDLQEGYYSTSSVYQVHSLLKNYKNLDSAESQLSNIQ